MSDQFKNIKKFNDEIGQPSYVEFITVEEKTEIAILGPSPNVENSLYSLAFNKNKRRYIEPNRSESKITAIPKIGIPQKYSINQNNNQNNQYKNNKIASEFKSTLFNPYATGIECVTSFVTCSNPETGCMIDFGVCLDDTGTMGPQIEQIKNSINSIAEYFQEISNGNYRMGLVTFKDCPPISRLKFPTNGSCGNIEEFKNALSMVTAEGGGLAFEAGDIALEWCVDGRGFGPWRDDPNVRKVILYITDAFVGGCDDAYSPSDKDHLLEVAEAAGQCGIKIICGIIGSYIDPMISNEHYGEVARLSNGIYVFLPSNGAGLESLIYSYIFALCWDTTNLPECIGGEDIILNGNFDTNIAGWTQYQPSVAWNSTKGAMELGVGPGGTYGIARQSIAGLTPGDLVTLFFDVEGGSVNSTLTYGFVDDQIATYNTTINAASTRHTINTNVPESGIITIFFETNGHQFIDDVKLCLVQIAECGVGTINLVRNSNFSEGVQYWTDDNNIQLTPSTDSRWWDNVNDALLVSSSGASVVKQEVAGFTIGSPMVFSFTLLSHEPNEADVLSLEYELLNSGGGVILSGIISNGDITEFPFTMSRSFTTTSTSVYIRFKTGEISGIAKIRDVYICNLTGACYPRSVKLSYDTFDENRGQWVGGNYSITNKNIYIPPGGSITRSYNSLLAGSVFSITVEILENEDSQSNQNNGIIIEILSSGTANNQFISPRSVGLVTYSVPVLEPTNGSLPYAFVTIRPQSNQSGATVDNILCCVTNDIDCNGSIKNLSANIELVGIPRTPINIFNVFARLTLRNTLNPFDKTTVNLIPISEGHISLTAPTSCGTGTTCDYWKQQGNGGIVETLITSTGLTSSNVASINLGNFRSLGTRNNWLWSIPSSYNSTIQDKLVISFPQEIIGNDNNVVESVEIFYLANKINIDSIEYSYPTTWESSGPAENPPGAYGPEWRVNESPTTSNASLLGPDDNTSLRVALSYLEESDRLILTGYNITDSSNILSAAIFIMKLNGFPGGGFWTSNGIYIEELYVTNDGVNPYGSNLAKPEWPEWDVFNQGWITVSDLGNYINNPNFGFILKVKKRNGFNIGQVVFGGLILAIERDRLTPACPGTFAKTPDPSISLNIGIKYQNNLNLNREFSTTVLYSTLYEEEGERLQWDTISTLGNGIKGNNARWHVAKFNLDTVDGTGIDQCTSPTSFVATGTGNLDLGEFRINGSAVVFDPCDAEVIVEEIVKGAIDNETQLITLPNPTGGTWDLTVTINGDSQTATIPWNTTSAVLQNRIGLLSNVGRNNVSVSNSGNQYTIEFINDLSGVNIPLMTADGSNLTGTASGIVETLVSGTRNERQTITVAPGTLNDLIVEFNGETSLPITYNWSLNQKQAAIEAISTIGVGNVTVSGDSTDRDSPYTGNLIIDFIGSLSNNNVPNITVQPEPFYTANTNWHGGSAVNERQRIRVVAASGTFTIKIYKPEDENIFFITSPIPYNANDIQIKDAILASSYIAESDINVVKTPTDTNNPFLNEWTIEFKGAYSGIDFKQMEIDSSQLRGGNVIITSVLNGGQISEKQRITILRANSGFFRLRTTINGVNRLSGKIVWNTTASGLQNILEQHPEIDPGDIVVVQNGNGPDPDVTGRFTITFRGYGDVQPIIPEYRRTLLCNPIILKPVPSPPYQYPLEPECEIEDLSCQSGPLLNRPCPGDEPSIETQCCDEINIRESANISVQLSIQRDLFDMNRKIYSTNGNSKNATIKDIVRSKGIDVNRFTPYLRNFLTGQLTETTYTKELQTGLSIILIEKQLDTDRGKSRISNYLANHREILPTRMAWPSNLLNIQ